MEQKKESKEAAANDEIETDTPIPVISQPNIILLLIVFLR